MSYSLLPFVLLLLSIVAIIVIILRKFPQITLLDVDNLPEVKEEKKKDQFLKNRVDKKVQENKRKIMQKINFLRQLWQKIQSKFRQYVGRVQKQSEHVSELDTAQPAEEKNENISLKVDVLLKEGDVAYELEDYEEAEKKFIEAIRIDPKNMEAYRGLGDVYLKQDQLKEAKETYSFLLQLDDDDDSILAKLGDIAQEEGDTDQAIVYYEKAILLNPNVAKRFAKLAELLQSIEQHQAALQAINEAVDLEPQNPKYLDKLVEISIIMGRTDLAEKAYAALRMVNPENRKLILFRQRIDEMK